VVVAGKVEHRRQAKVAMLLDAAWALARVHGVAGLTLHGLAREVGMRQPSLYEYFDSKHALYDAMFADGNRQLLERLGALDLPSEPRAALKRYIGELHAFALEDPARYELLFLRHLPDFEPSPASYELAQQMLGRAVELMHAAGVTDQGDIDCIVAVTAGLVDAQLANEPRTTRWVRHLDRLVDLVVDDALERSTHR